jgi:(2Fe-2S) ferredoxin
VSDPDQLRRYLVIVCRGPECGERRDSRSIHREILLQVQALGLAEHTQVSWQSCFGRCRQGPNVLVRPAKGDSSVARPSLLAAPPVRAAEGAALYGDVHVEDVAEILQSHVRRGIIVRRFVLKPEQGVPERRRSNAPNPAGDPGPDDPSGESR